jgi:hypothetical protein
MQPFTIRSAIVAASLAMTVNASAAAAQAESAVPVSASVDFSRFVPNPKTDMKVDYSVWNDILDNMVFLTGLPTRQIAPKPEAIVGTKSVWEHTSPYRLEGNKIPFSVLKEEHVSVLNEYKRDLEELSTRVDISSLPKKEQLAFWLNLHNMVVITQIATNYPVLQPNRILIGPDKVPLHDAKIISVGGSMLSLRDIRENIVYPNWKDPKTVYGFFLGDIGSPSIQSQAFTADNTDKLLNFNGEEFVNSLRSFSRGGVSKIYKDVERFYFADFDKDLRDHFQQFMWDDVLEELGETGQLKINSYEYDIADMEGGHGPRAIGNVTINGKPVRDSQTRAIAAYTNQVRDKTQTLLRQGKIKRGEVIVGDGDDTDTPPSETGNPSESGDN